MTGSIMDFGRLVVAEALKLKRSPVLRMVWLLPLVFLVLEFLVFERPALAVRALPDAAKASFETLHLQLVGSLWGGFFHPLMVALLPALLFRSEHRFKLWHHLHSMPVSRRSLFLAKALWLALLSLGSLILVGLGLWLERGLIGRLNPLLAGPFHGLDLARALAWLWLGSLPILALYLWLSDRISNAAVPAMMGVVGLLLTISLSGVEPPKSWQRDLNPWVLPYFCAQYSMQNQTPKRTVHMAGKLFQEEPNVLRLPNGKKFRTWQSIPDEELFPSPPPTPKWLLAAFSLGGGAIFLTIGFLDAGRNRV